MVSTMSEHFETIVNYLKSEGIEYIYNDEDEEMLNVVIGKTSSGKRIFEQIISYDNLFMVYLSMKFGSEIDTKNKQVNYRVFEYIHRVNNGMIRGNFEYDIDKKTIRFKHYFEKDVILDKEYIMLNITLPVMMFKTYMNCIDDIITTKKSLKTIIKKIESKEDTD